MACIGCEIKEEAQNMDIQALIEEQLALEQHLAPEKLFQQRIQTCEQCPFRSLHTCTKCGCFYEFRAHLANKKCPAARWEE
ncbi:DUF6171 family protein [Enterococcus sp.]|uniref:DUF6171 family protein n=1 Tax=Enterococcus sp. TaxID=35783 RepID=UPI0029147EA1|nr:DUF6171 family protein [Enterococcus sp.]MDU5336515.1 DUF6171 family protein [Enterococcus sp.]